MTRPPKEDSRISSYHLERELKDRVGLSLRESHLVVMNMLDLIREHLENGDDVVLRGIGTFKHVIKPSVRKFFRGEYRTYPTRPKVICRVSDALIRKVQGK